MSKTLIAREDTATIIEKESRFGRIVIDLQNEIYFPYGLLGIENSQKFYVAKLLDKNLSKYSLLQSVDDENLSLLTIMLDPSDYLTEDSFLNSYDVKSALKNLRIQQNYEAIMLIATIEKENNNTRISLNQKAPIIINLENKIADQYVFLNNDYSLKYYLV